MINGLPIAIAATFVETASGPLAVLLEKTATGAKEELTQLTREAGEEIRRCTEDHRGNLILKLP